MKIKTHDFANDGVYIKETDSLTGAVKITEVMEYAEVPDTDAGALSLISRADTAARKGHAGAMRFILSALSNINPVYQGRGLLTDESGKKWRAKQSTEDARKQYNGYKEAFRDVCSSAMMPALLVLHKNDEEKARADLTEKRAKGIFAVSSSAARKFFYFTGMFPCAYSAQGEPDFTRALSVSAMQKILSEIPEEETDGHTFAAKVRALMKTWEEKGGRTEDPADMSALLGYLDQWRDEVRAAETSALMATTGALLPATRAFQGSEESARVVEEEIVE